MAVFRIEIPRMNLDGGADMRSHLMTWEWRTPRADTDEVIFDFRKNQFIEPWALVQYVAYALWLRNQFQLPVRAETDPVNDANRYILAMGIDHVLQTGESIDAWDESTQNTGLHVIRTHKEVKRFVESAARLGRGTTAEWMDALKYGMAELGRNVVQHAAAPTGGVAMAQYFPVAKTVQFSISDRGRGLRRSLERNYPELRSDLEAAKLAVLPHSSGAPELLLRLQYKDEIGPYASPENAGLGLFFCKEIAWRARGAFWLASQTALLGVRCDNKIAQHRIYRRINPWEGTTVTMHFPAQGVVDFADLLHVCQSLARAARASSGEAGLDFLTDLPDDFEGERVRVGDFLEDVEEASNIRRSKLLPAVDEGRWVVLDFTDVRFATQSFVEALIYEPLRARGSLLRLSFLNCTRATEEAVRTVAAYAASYRQLR